MHTELQVQKQRRFQRKGDYRWLPGSLVLSNWTHIFPQDVGSEKRGKKTRRGSGFKMIVDLMDFLSATRGNQDLVRLFTSPIRSEPVLACCGHPLLIGLIAD